MNDRILPNYEKPDEIMVIEVDHIFTKEQIEKSLDIFRSSDLQQCDTRQVEVWKGFKHRVPADIPEREKRIGVVFWSLKKLDKLPPTGRQANCRGRVRIPTYAYNLGFAVSKDVMYWKHLTAIGFSQKIRKVCKKLFVAVPLGDGKNYFCKAFELDKTHIIREPLDWWKASLSNAGFKVKEAKYRMKYIKENYAQFEAANGFFICT